MFGAIGDLIVAAEKQKEANNKEVRRTQLTELNNTRSSADFNTPKSPKDIADPNNQSRHHTTPRNTP